MSRAYFVDEVGRQAYLKDVALRFMTVKRKSPGTFPPETQTMTMQVSAPPGWPDGRQLEVRVHRIGKGKRALLVHGWQSQAADLHTLSETLVDGGFEVWMPDLPAHGYSSGTYLSLPLAAATLKAVQSLAGSFSLAIGHSYGGASVMHAIDCGLHADRVAVLASPTHYGRFARRAADRAGLPLSAVPEWLELVATMTGTHPDEISMEQQVAKLTLPILLIHGTDDQIIPIGQSEAVAARYPLTTWLPLHGIGHFDLLINDFALKSIVNFGLDTNPYPGPLIAAARTGSINPAIT